MKIEEFYSRYKDNNEISIETLSNRWENETAVDNFLNTAVTGGVTVADLLTGDGMLDQISPEVLEALQNILTERPENYHEARVFLLDKISKGDKSVLGAINNIKGKIGELEFKRIAEESGLNVRLAPSVNQEGWDLAIDHSDATEYIQVKMYTDPYDVTRAMEELNLKLQDGIIKDEDIVINNITFAIPEDIIEETSVLIEERGLDVSLRSIPLSAGDAGNIVQDSFDIYCPPLRKGRKKYSRI